MSQSKRKSLAESIAQNVIGQFLAWLVLVYFYGQRLDNFLVMGTMFIVSFCRSYIIRRFFNWLN